MRIKEGKPIGTNTHIGRCPVSAFGNSAGDREMLEWIGEGSGSRLMILVLHDDAKREYDYDPVNEPARMIVPITSGTGIIKPSSRSMGMIGVNDHPQSGWLGFCRQRRQETGARSALIVAGETGGKAPGLENPIKIRFSKQDNAHIWADTRLILYLPVLARQN